MDIIDRYEEAATGFTARLDAVTDDQWANPTPCTDWNVRELVDHVITIQRQIPESLGMAVGDDGADPRATWKAVRAAALTALRQPDVLDRTMRGIQAATRCRWRWRSSPGCRIFTSTPGTSPAQRAATSDSIPRSPPSCSSA